MSRRELFRQFLAGTWAKGGIENMHRLTLSLIVGFLMAYSSMWLASRINDRYTRWEENLCRVLVKRGKKEDYPTVDLFGSFYLGCIRLRNLAFSNIRKETCPMTAYEFY